MTSNSNAAPRTGGLKKKPYRIIGTAVLVVAIGLVILWFKVVRGGEDPANTVATFVAKRGPLTISVLEAGALKAKDPEIIRNQVEGRTTIISIVPEGTRVNKGDLLIELDVSTLRDRQVDQQILVNNADAAYVNSKENLNITMSQADSDIDLAKLKLVFARQDLEKYTGKDGQYDNDYAAAEGTIAMNQAELKKDTDYWEWSKKLAAEKYLSDTQLQADELAMKRSDLNVKVSQNNLNLLTKYTKERQVAQLESDVNQAGMALERTQAKARANITQAKADLAAKEQELKRQQDKLAKIVDQIEKARVFAPTEGMVVYATSSRGGGFRNDRQPLADGVEVWERQELIYLPRSSSTVAEVDVHEASLQKVRAGLPAVVTVDALPGKKFMGTVSQIAPLPDPQSMWMNPDLKVYKTEIALDVNDPQLRSGMNCKAEIIVEQHTDTVYIPVQAVLRVGGQPTAYVLNDDGQTEERKVEIGLDDNSMVRIVSGLNEGEHVLLTPPLKAGAVEPGSRLAGIRGADANEVTQQITDKLKAANEPVPNARRQRGGPGQTGSGNGDAGAQSPGGGAVPSLTPEQRQALKQRIDNLSPEERQKMQKMQEQLRSGSRGGGRQGDSQGVSPDGGRAAGGGGGRGGRQGGSDQGQQRAQ
jgi:HlyD family secretion protein